MSLSDTTRRTILAEALKLAPFEGWTDRTLRQAVKAAELPDGAAALYFEGGVLDLLDFWARELDAQAQSEIATLDLSRLKIRERVTQAVLARLTAIAPHEEAARRASARLALPDGFARGVKQLWSTSDMIWHAIGDTSTDANFYSKRMVLSGVLATTLPVWLSDSAPDHAQGRAFLDARIANVMQFETFKFQVKSATQDMPNPAEILGSLRYGGFDLLTRKKTGRARRRRYSR